LKPLREDFIFLSVERYLRKQSWEILGGEPPDGTSNRFRRIYIRSPGIRPRLHSQDSLKVDLISAKQGILLLSEVKPRYSESDKSKLDIVAGERRNDLFDAIWERCKIPKSSFKSVVKSLAFTAELRVDVPPDFVFFLVYPNQTVVARTGGLVNPQIFG